MNFAFIGLRTPQKKPPTPTFTNRRHYWTAEEEQNLIKGVREYPKNLLLTNFIDPLKIRGRKLEEYIE
jgi:hypothetical protein